MQQKLQPKTMRRTRTLTFLRFATLPALIPLLPACGNLTSYKGGDALKVIYGSRVAQLRSAYAYPDAIQNKLDGIRQDHKNQGAEERNRFLNDFVFLIDTNYHFWEKTAYNKKSTADFTSDVTAATLGTLSGIVTGGGAQGAKSLLSFISSGIISTKASFNQDVLQNQNLLAIIAKTQALRAQKLLALQKGMYVKNGNGDDATLSARPLAEYSAEQGMVDLAAYYEAGTFVAALQDIIDQSGADKVKAQKVIDEKVKNIPSLDSGLGASNH